MESVHGKKRQQRFSHRRLIVKPQLSFSTPQNQQSTLTQLEFVSTPRGSVQSDEYEGRPSKLIKRNRHQKNTLTQIGFGDLSGELSEWPNTHVKDSYPDEEITMSSQTEEIVQSTPRRNSSDVQEVVQKTPRRNSPDVQEMIQKTPRRDSSDIQEIVQNTRRSSSNAQEIVPASQPSNTETTRYQTASQYSTPRAGRRIEAPSSQTPSSIVLSTGHRSRSPVVQKSPLHNRGSSHRSKIVILSSPVIARDFAVTQPDVETLQAFQRNGSLANAGMNDRDEDDPDQHSEEDEDLNYDPAMSALDRDAARYGMTQYQPTAKVRETQLFLQSSPHEEYDLPESPAEVEEKPHTQVMSIPDSQPITPIKSVAPSQVSTISPTQDSKRQPTVNTLGESSLPRPPWTESEELEWIEKENAMLARINTLSSEYSLPVPPAFDET